MQFRLWLEAKWNKARLLYILRGLAAEARKAGSFENFKHDYSRQIKHGLYFHWTDDPDFHIDIEKGPRDMSSLANGGMDKGKFMVTSHLSYWSNYGGSKGRPYVAIIDMSEVPREAYQQVNRGFGNEFFVNNPNRAKVYKVVTRQQAFQFDRTQNEYLPGSDEELSRFYQFATAHDFV